MKYFRMLLCSWEYFRMLLCSWEYFRMLLCSSWTSSGFMWMNGQMCIWTFADECIMSFWVVLWILSLYNFRMLLDQICLAICLGTCADFNKVELSLQAMLLGDLVCFVQYQLPYVSKSCWFRLDLAFGFAFCFPTTVLFMSEKGWSRIEHSELRRLQNVSFVSLRMICKTLIWCNQILIVKHWWSAAWKTSRMIFLMEYSWCFVLQMFIVLNEHWRCPFWL